MLTHRLQSIFLWLFLIGLVISLTTYLKKDDFPAPDFYDTDLLKEPLQSKTGKRPFETHAGEQTYQIHPLYDYELYGVVVSYNDSDGFTDTTHHRRWQDYLNIRDLCVVWGDNISSNVYREMSFSNDSWTCWAYWDNAEIASRFSMSQLSNNHLLADDDTIKQNLMSAQIGDQIHLKGFLASYSNPGNGFKRGTSTVRSDTGNGACETIYLEEFDILKQANQGDRRLFAFAKWLTFFALLGFITMLFISPVRQIR